MIEFGPDLFTATVTFRAPIAGSDPVLGGETGGTSLAACVEPETRTMGRDESHRVPEGRQRWLVHTRTNPGCGVDWLCLWGSRSLRVTAMPATVDGWNLWRTECVEVS